MTNEELLQIIEEARKDKRTELDLSGKGLTTLPPEIVQLQSLTSLDLSDKQFTTLPPEIGQLRCLTSLYLNDNKFTTLPPEIEQLQNLEEFDLYNNKFTTIPIEIYQLQKLRIFGIDYNRLSIIPPEIGRLKNLEELNLYVNKITILPPEIGQLQNLNILQIEDNQLTTLPPEIGQLQNLTSLNLRKNNLPIPPEILEKTNKPTTILNYYFQHVQAKERRQLNEAKMLLVGQGSVGKTSLVKRLIENKFNPKEPKTKGIKISDWNVDGIKLNIWDFGGQEIMHATHQFFLTKRSLYLLVLNAREDEYNNRIEYWLKLIESFGGDSPVIVVINKCDDEELPDFAKQALKSKYEIIKDFVFVSCEDGRGREELIKTISEHVSRLEHVQDELPLSWFNVKSKLETLRKEKKDYISYEKFETICKNEGITDRKSPETLIGFMHDLGVALNFRDDLELMGTNVLNPEWVTNGVYKILNYHLLFKANGVLEIEMLSDILQPPEYPEDKHLFVMEMMRKFELCFDFEGFANKRFLIPDMLPKDEAYTGEWEDEDCLCFLYKYNVLPSSIMSRFIVRSHKCIHKNTYWRSGVVLKKDGNKALVKADIEEKTICIHVNGPRNTRRELLAVIRGRLKEIHGTISKLEADEKVPLPGRPDIVVDYEHLLQLERMGEQTFVPKGYAGKINVKDLLNGLEPEADRLKRDEGNYEKRLKKLISPPVKEPLDRKTKDYINKEAVRHAKLNQWIHIFGWILAIAMVVLYDQLKDISKWTYLIGCVLPLLSFIYYGITGRAYNPKTISENLNAKKRKEIFVKLGRDLDDFDELMR